MASLDMPDEEWLASVAANYPSEQIRSIPESGDSDERGRLVALLLL